MTRTAALALLLLAPLATACGGEADAEPTPTAAGAGFRVTDGVTPDELAACLTQRGLSATATDTTMLGVEVPHAEVEVSRLGGADGPGTQNADLWVFADPAAAADNAAYLTLGGSDDPTDSRYRVAGNVVATFWQRTAEPPTADERVVLGCLPG